MIRNAGGVVTDDEIRSLAISQRLLGTEEIILIHHTDCGMLTFTDDDFKAQIQEETGIKPEWAAEAFADLDEDVRQSIARIKASPFIPRRTGPRLRLPGRGRPPARSDAVGDAVLPPGGGTRGCRAASSPGAHSHHGQRHPHRLRSLLVGRGRDDVQHRQRRQRDEPARDLADRLRGRVVGVVDDQRRAGVGLLAQRHRQRHLAEQRHVELVGELLAAALAEELEALARRAS